MKNEKCFKKPLVEYSYAVTVKKQPEPTVNGKNPHTKN